MENLAEPLSFAQIALPARSRIADIYIYLRVSGNSGRAQRSTATLPTPRRKSIMNTPLRNIVCLTFICLPAGQYADICRKNAEYGRYLWSSAIELRGHQGQIDHRVKFLSRGSGYSLFLTQEEAVLALKKKGIEYRQVRILPLSPLLNAAQSRRARRSPHAIGRRCCDSAGDGS
jgi:hypothetical protein